MATAGKTFCEFFAGIGLVRAGLAPSGWTCVYANDVDPKKQQLYDAHFGPDEHFHLRDVHDTPQVVARIPGSPFLATASFPCIDLSLAGHGRGFDGAHSSTFFGFADAVSALGPRKPRLILLENVPGFVTSRGGRDFEAALQSLAALGYWVDAFVLDAKDFLPQSRPRVFVIGLHETVHAPSAHRKSPLDWLADAWSETVERAPRTLRPPRLLTLLRSLDLPTGLVAFDVPPPARTGPDLASLIDLDDDQDWWPKPAVDKHHDMMSPRHRVLVDGLLTHGETFIGTIFRRKRAGATRAEVRSDGVAGCLRTPKGGSARQIVIVVESGRLRMRWMSPREYARLQGAPDFPLVANTTQNLHGFGDAVCVPVIRWIDRHVLTPVFDAESRTPRKPTRGRQPDPRAASSGDASRERQEHLA